MSHQSPSLQQSLAETTTDDGRTSSDDESAGRAAAEGTSRRRAITGAGILAGSAAVLTACGSGSSDDAEAADIDPNNPVDIAAVDDVPEGDAVKASADGVTAMVAQPTKGVFKAFSSSCTHQGCSLNVQNKAISCPCHSSQFSIQDGSVQGGPAPKPLPEYTVKVEDGRIKLS
ncbi:MULTISPECIES: Rieske (2Fe-2S) protein [Micrococcaceae]|uniref:Rieske (2Fe-2S) protein n=1 Tax=unclassified Kocuria TaxID=2649579 RepID=UPI00101351BF|nr:MULTISPECIES: Rieske (2Fe-2S) protein [unclassified Kocuria]